MGSAIHQPGRDTAYTGSDLFLQRALTIDETVLGPDHPDVATGLNNLALLYNAQGQYAKAEALYKRALGIKEKALGPEHPDVATSLVNYAALLRETHRTAEAAKMRGRATAIWETQEERARKAGKIRLMMAVVSSQAEGEALLVRVRSGTVFQGKDVGFVLPSDLDVRFADAVKNLNVGGLSRVVQTEKGYFVFKRTE